MKHQVMYRSKWAMSMALLIIFAMVGCTGQVNPPSEPSLPPPTDQGSTPTSDAASSPTPPGVESTATSQPVTDNNVLYQDEFTNPGTGWDAAEFDNYFIGYHEPEWYHIEIRSANSKAVVSEPERRSVTDATVELQVYTNSAKTATEGDFRYGLIFRRSGDNYYAFTISPRTKKWEVLKSSSNGLGTLQEGVEENINDLDVDDILRVDLQGSNFFLHINDRLVGEVTDPDYPGGEVGLYAQNFDSTTTHIHFNTFTIRDFEAPVQDPENNVLYQDDFTNPSTGWDAAEFDNYFIGYHEPEWYHIEIRSANSKAVVSEPERRSVGDATLELQVYTNSAKTATEGDFRYGLIFRRSGDNYYAFTISPRTKKWEVLKSSSNGLETLQEGVEEGIHDLDVDDILRVDAQGSSFLFHINDQLVGQVSDPEYTSGEVGFYAQSVDSPSTHIHFNTFTIRDLTLSLMCNINEGGTVNVRTGPSKTFPQIAVLSSGDTVKALGMSPNQWIQIIVEGSNEPGWVSYSDGYMTCTPSVDLFPVVNP